MNQKKGAKKLNQFSSANNTAIPGAMSATDYMNQAISGARSSATGTSPDQDIMLAAYDSRPSPTFPQWTILLKYYYSNALFKNFIDRPVEDSIKDISFSAKEGLDDEQIGDINYIIKRKGIYNVYRQALIASRIFGGGCILFLNEDSKKNIAPLSANEENVDVIAVTCWDVNDMYLDSGRLITGKRVYKYAGIDLHPSRAILIKNRVPFRYFKNITMGWGMSEYDAVGQYFNIYSRYWDNIFTLLKIMSLDVFSVEDLESAINTEQGKKKVMTAVKAMNEAKSVHGTIIKSKDDDFSRHQIDIAGAVSISDKMADLLSAACGMPKRYLFGDDPKGLFNGGEGSIEIYSSKIASLREEWTPSLIELLEKICLLNIGYIPESLDVSFDTTRLPTFTEALAEKTTRITEAKDLLEKQLMSPEEFIDEINSIKLFSTELTLKDLDSILSNKEEENEDPVETSAV